MSSRPTHSGTHNFAGSDAFNLGVRSRTGLEQSRSPYSKSHERRLKRKAREQVAGGMSDIQAAISAVEDAIPVAVQNSVAADPDAGAGGPDAPQPKRVKPKPGQIGEGKGVPLTKNQRKRAL